MMKESPLKKSFGEAIERFGQEPEQQNVARLLSLLREVAVDFQEAGVPAGIEARPGSHGCQVLGRSSLSGRCLANGTFTLGREKLEFSIQHSAWCKMMTLDVFWDDETVISQTSRADARGRWREISDDEKFTDSETVAENGGPPIDLKRQLTDLLAGIHVRSAFTHRFSLDPDGATTAQVRKSIAVAAPLKPKG